MSVDLAPLTSKYKKTCGDVVVKLVIEGGVTQEPFTIPLVLEVSFVTTFTLEPPEEGLIVNVIGADICPPLDTLIDAVPADAIRPELTDAVSLVEVMNVVGRVVPFHSSAAPEAKLVPFTVRVNAEPPALAEEGDRLAIIGVLLVVPPEQADPPTPKHIVAAGAPHKLEVSDGVDVQVPLRPFTLT